MFVDGLRHANGFIFAPTNKSGIGLPAGEHRLASTLNADVLLLSHLAPDGFVYDGHCIVEFDADSLRYETSLTITALGLRQGIKTHYHVFQHFPS